MGCSVFPPIKDLILFRVSRGVLDTGLQDRFRDSTLTRIPDLLHRIRFGVGKLHLTCLKEDIGLTVGKLH